ncbi:CRISPR-associated helicase Cas3' [Blautia sp. HCP3S3_C12]|uniref:CRISPR-associated helicase Cas3' n=1 Tax=unclassified Blautia TaxID=2648079 RepID=UPI003F8BD3E0
MYHHDYCDPIKTILEREDTIKENLAEVKNEIFKLSKKFYTQLAMVKDIEDTRAVKIKGYLHKCDYSASGNYMIEYPHDFLEQGLENCMRKWQRKNPNVEWNSLQRFCMEKQNQNIIAIAQTGMGKTEGGLWWIGNHKGYFVLPLRTAINAIYDRVCEDILENENLSEKVSLLHSESLEYYVKKNVGTDEEIFQYEQRGKAFSIPLSISTMDQLFNFVFKYQGYELKLTTLSYSRIVIDEIQMYSPDLLAYLIYGLEHIAKMGGKIAIMTATLSPFVKELLEKYVGFSKDNQKVFINDSIRHNVEVRDRKINAKDILDLYEENERKGISNKILVVCNKIATAQKLMEEVKAEVAGKNISVTVNIFHSRFIKKDRTKLEEEIIKFGKTYDKNGNLDKQSGIWIATSIVEASLDIDFDYLFTELLDLNSLFQRFGRCNRKGAKNVTMYNCYVYTQLDEGDFILGNKGFIDKTIFELSNKSIHDINGKLSESKKQELINRYLTTENISQSHFIKKFREKYRFIDSISIYSFKKNENKLRNILSETIIPETVYEKYKEEIDTISQKLNSERLTAIERKCLRSNILQYSLEIPYYHWNSYEKAMKKGCMHQYQSINLSPGEKIKVMQCRYDEMGYYRIVDDVD